LVQMRAGLWCKLDYLMPTGSFKDRGAAVLMSLAADLGVDRVVVDSSGNAGTAIAAYAAQAGIDADVYVPRGAPPDKVAAIESHGARVVEVPGGRAAAAVAAQKAVFTDDRWYASHVFRPAFCHGVKTLAFELWEQLGRRPPGTVVAPAGNGTLIIGLWIGFRELAATGRIDRVPSIVAVQSEACAPLAGRPVTGPTAATGIAIADPPRGQEVRAAVVASGGRVLTVPEAALGPARADLNAAGLTVEITSAAVWAAWRLGEGPAASADRGPVVLILSGANG